MPETENSGKRSIVVEILEQLTLSALRRSVRTQRAIRESKSLETHDQGLDHRFIEDAKLLPDRIEMLRRLPRGGVVGEIGVAGGNFSRQILDICQPDRLHLIDPWNEEAVDKYSSKAHERVAKRFEAEVKSHRVILHRGFSFDVLPKLEENLFDWVYLDGAHDYANVKRDLACCKRVVKPGGLIAGHDYLRWVGPTARYGVVEAVNEFMLETESRLVFLTNQFDKHDSYVLRLNKS